jgi:hypothetical protein
MLPDFQKRIVFPNIPRLLRLAFWYEQRADENEQETMLE